MTGAPSAPDLAGGVTLEALFRANAAARPGAAAVVDPPNRASFTDGAPLQLTYAELDARVERLAQTLCSFGMPSGSVVAVQLPNVAEAAVALLAILRAGLRAAPVPMLWRRSDLVAALAGVAPRALITLARFDGERPAETACEAAAELFDLSFPCAFGENVPDGVVPLDRIEVPAGLSDPAPSLPDPTAVSLLTFDADAQGFFPVPRSDAQWLAVGLATLLESKIANRDTILATLPPHSLAGIGACFVPWLLCGGTLALVHGAAPEAPAAGGRTHLVAPAAALAAIARTRTARLAACIAVHRGPHTHKLDLSQVACGRLVDFHSFGEIGAVVLARKDARESPPLPLGGVSAPLSTVGGPVVVETRLADGRIWLRGPMVPREAEPSTAGAFRAERDADGFACTGYRAHCDSRGKLVVDAGPDRVVSVGGLRFGLDDLRSRFSACGEDVKVSAVEDSLLGERLHIDTADRAAAAAALSAAGHSQLVIEAAAGTASQRAGA